MNESPKLSIIIPVYNAFDYLTKCITSALTQTLADIEIIIINDGSPDPKVLPLLQKYEKNDKRIVLVDKNNEGVAKTRQVGIDIAKSKYIAFLDCDDFFAQNAMELLWAKAEANNFPDLISGNYWWCFEHENNCHLGRAPLENIQIPFLKKYFSDESSFLSIWGCLIKKELFDTQKIFLPITAFFADDVVLNIQLAFAVTSVAWVNEPTYYHIHRQQSQSRKLDYKLQISLTYLMKWTYNFLKDEPEYKNSIDLAVFMLKRWLWLISSFGKCDDQELKAIIYSNYYYNQKALNKFTAKEQFIIKSDKNAFHYVIYQFYWHLIKPVMRKIFLHKYNQK